MSEPDILFTPRAISLAISLETAEYLARVSTSTLNMTDFISLVYVTVPRIKYFDAPGSDVKRDARAPPVQDSATLNVSLFSVIFSFISSSKSSPRDFDNDQDKYIICNHRLDYEKHLRKIHKIISNSLYITYGHT